MLTIKEYMENFPDYHTHLDQSVVRVQKTFALGIYLSVKCSYSYWQSSLLNDWGSESLLIPSATILLQSCQMDRSSGLCCDLNLLKVLVKGRLGLCGGELSHLK